MQALETIERLNAEATAAEIPKLRAAGKFVVCTYAGLNYLQHAPFDTVDQAQSHIAAHAAGNNAGERTQLLEPTATIHKATDDAAVAAANDGTLAVGVTGISTAAATAGAAVLMS